MNQNFSETKKLKSRAKSLTENQTKDHKSHALLYQKLNFTWVSMAEVLGISFLSDFDGILCTWNGREGHSGKWLMNYLTETLIL